MYSQQAISVLKSENIKITPARKAIIEIIEKAKKHLTINDIFVLAQKKVNNIGIATTYRTVKLLCDFSLLEKHEFENRDACYEKKNSEEHHHHLIDINSSKVIEFDDEVIDKVLEEIAKKKGYKLVDHKIEIYGEKI